ncbi:MAG: copper homeostasis protein CutC [Bacteroidetes bacterium]|nr:copper homeostasis protein CutC [Bacteroidota bacterium]
MRNPANSILLEVCAATVHSVIAAEEGGAHRIELCEALEIGGTTPSPGLFLQAKRWSKLPIFVLIRPGTRDFCYSPIQKQQMLEDIHFFRDNGADAIVSGALLPDGSPDLPFLEQLVHASGELPFTFHRAADHFSNPVQSLIQLRDLGVRRVLSSGGKAKAIDALDTLVNWQNNLGSECIVLAGGGVESKDAPAFAKAGIREVHGSFRKIENGPMVYRPETPRFGDDFFYRSETLTDSVREFITLSKLE